MLAAVALGAVWGYEGVVWGNPLAWVAALAVLIPAYLRAHRRLDDLRPAGEAPHAPPTAVVVAESSDGGVLLDALGPDDADHPDDVGHPALAGADR